MRDDKLLAVYCCDRGHERDVNRERAVAGQDGGARRQQAHEVLEERLEKDQHQA
jgi:hypothetical protein